MEAAATAPRRRTRKDAAPAAPSQAEQIPLPEVAAYVPPSPTTKALELPGTYVELDLRGAAALPRDLGAALRVGAPVVRKVACDPLAKSAPAMEVGMQTPDLQEYFIGATDLGVAGILTLARKDTGWQASMSKNLLPFVLSSRAVKEAAMPALGQSALPASIAGVIPAQYRYWEQGTPEGAQRARDALVETGMFDERLVKLVDGQMRLCVEQLYLYEPDAAPASKAAGPENADFASVVLRILPAGKRVVTPFADEKFSETLRVEARDPNAVLVLSPPGGPIAPFVEDLVKAAPAAAWLFEYDNAEAANVTSLAKLGPLFTLPDAPGRVFVASFDPGETAIWQRPPAAPEPVVAAKRADLSADAKLVGATSVRKLAHVEKEERYVLGIVLEPETVDAQQDIYSPSEIAASAHTFMEKYRTVGLMHKGAINDKVKILESYLAPVDFEVDGAIVKKGTWLMAVRVLDDDLWTTIKDGGLTGFSIGGSAIRKPDAVVPPN